MGIVWKKKNDAYDNDDSRTDMSGSKMAGREKHKVSEWSGLLSRYDTV